MKANEVFTVKVHPTESGMYALYKGKELIGIVFPDEYDSILSQIVEDTKEYSEEGEPLDD
jgi:hypothetical protein